MMVTASHAPNPDLSLVLGADAGKSGGSSDNEALIIGVSVAIPLAVAVVVGVILIAVILAWQRRRGPGTSASMINFDAEEAHEDL